MFVKVSEKARTLPPSSGKTSVTVNVHVPFPFCPLNAASGLAGLNDPVQGAPAGVMVWIKSGSAIVKHGITEVAAKVIKASGLVHQRDGGPLRRGQRDNKITDKGVVETDCRRERSVRATAAVKAEIEVTDRPRKAADRNRDVDGRGDIGESALAARCN